MKPRGLGDSIERFTQATGIKKVVNTISKVTGKDCGCNKRKEALNKKFPYKNNKQESLSLNEIVFNK
jgi:hypothetical protein